MLELYCEIWRKRGKSEADIEASMKRCVLATGIPRSALNYELSPENEQAARAFCSAFADKFFADPAFREVVKTVVDEEGKKISKAN